METRRFSLLILDPGEIYFEDFSTTFIPTDTTRKTYDIKKQDGRLKMCSKSLVFESKDITKPILKIPLKDCSIIEEFKGKAKFLKNQKNVLYISCKQYIEMLEGNIIAPYTFCPSGTFLFLFKYANIADCLSRISQLHRASSLPAVEQADMIATIVHSRHARVKFDPLWLDLYEKIIMETEADKITPLVVNPGRILLSSTTLYFQPYNNIEQDPVLKIELSSVKRLVKRRFLLRHIGLEIYYSIKETEQHLYLAFRKQLDRDTLYANCLLQSELKLLNIEQEVMTLQWQNGCISNYEYLQYINSLADRTTNDLTQYPVFPWVISDYKSDKLDLNDPKVFRDLSKPVGALNEERLHKLLERFEEMPPPQYIYGSHYSTPAFVLFYLARQYPHYVLCLQNGRFDHPDRMFNSLEDVYKNCMHNMTDFKELIPEFYDTEQDGAFLMNSKGINFGTRHDGRKIGDVKLPPWAESPKHFIETLRNALESDYVSENLHLWIDLIFGYKQRGEEAIKANNLYYYLSYEGSVDLESIDDLNNRHALEVQIMEFGQIPKQVFLVPHPKRKTCLNVTDVQIQSPAICHDISANFWKSVTSLELITCFSTHKDAVSHLTISKDNNRVMSVGYDSKLKVFCLQQNRQIRSANIGNMPLSSCIQLPDSSILVIGSFANNIVLYDLDFGKITQSIMAHEDAITCLAWGDKLNLLASGSSDCRVRIWRSFLSTDEIKPVQCLTCQFDHNSHVTCICFSPENKYIASGTEDGEVYMWDIDEKLLFKKFPLHTSAVKAINYSPDGQKLASCGYDKVFQVIDISTGMPLYSKTLTTPLISLKWQDFIIFLGDEDGTLYIWDIMEVKLLNQIKAHEGELKVIEVSWDKSFVATGGGDSQVKIWKPT